VYSCSFQAFYDVTILYASIAHLLVFRKGFPGFLSPSQSKRTTLHRSDTENHARHCDDSEKRGRNEATGRVDTTWRNSYMRLVVSGAVAILGAVLLFASCNSDDSKGTSRASSDPGKLSTPVPGDGVRRITVTELKNAVDKNAVLIIDVRTPEAYEAEHIKGSINIPESPTASHSGELPRDKMIVTYCS
jgi:hypothetical protein